MSEIVRTFESEHYKILVSIISKDGTGHSTLTASKAEVDFYAGAVARDLSDRVERLLRDRVKA